MKTERTRVSSQCLFPGRFFCFVFPNLTQKRYLEAEELRRLNSEHDAYNETPRALEAECRALEAEQTIARMKIDAEELSRLISHHETCVLEAELHALGG